MHPTNQTKPTLLDDINSLHDLSDTKFVRECKERVGWLNILDPNNEPIFSAAREKGLIK